MTLHIKFERNQVSGMQDKAHGCVSVAKKNVLYISVLFTGTPKSLFSTPGISITSYWANLPNLS